MWDKKGKGLSMSNIRGDMTKDGLKSSVLANLMYSLAKDRYSATPRDNFSALAIAIRDRIVERWSNTQQVYHKKNVKRVYYLSMEFLIGRLMGNYIYNLGLENTAEQSLDEIGLSMEELREQEVDAGLGNGGLGRLAACFLDSMATLEIPAHGYGIRYDYGIFHQKIKDGYQIELPDEWLSLGNPWEFCRPEYTVKVRFYGRVEQVSGRKGKGNVKWVDTQDVLAVPYDTPIPGYKNDVVNTLRLWSAKSTDEFDFDYFNHGDYEKAVYDKIYSESISKVLYPNDSTVEGKELRLKQEYFFTAASIADIIRRFKVENLDLRKLPGKACVQLNDTHPTLAIVELMRVLVDDEGMKWEVAWDITKKTFAYTNHTLMPEALETWSVELLGRLLPRHLQIIEEINDCFLKTVVKKFPKDQERLDRMSVIDEGGERRIRMAQLAVVGSFSVNGVSQLHTDLLKAQLFKDFHEMYPKKFNNKTNGITQRRWLLKSNPLLSELITESIGDRWITDLNELKKLEPFKEKIFFRKRWQDIKNHNKRALAEYIYREMNIQVDPYSMFDVQIKRIHEYKRQLLFGLYIFSQYLMIKNKSKKFVQPRTFIIGGKAAPGYVMAKLIIKFLNSVGDIINKDKTVKDKIKVIYLENYRVSLAEKVFPAAELSEQISTGGTEASGTGNMKFMLNGAYTIGTLDGANVEMAEELGEDNISIFGLRTNEVEALRAKGYKSKEFIEKSPVLKEICDLMSNNLFSPYNHGLFNPIFEDLMNKDYFMLCADFDEYCQMQDVVSKMYQNKKDWTKKSIINTARVGRFSSDRTIREYAKEIWRVQYQKN